MPDFLDWHFALGWSCGAGIAFLCDWLIYKRDRNLCLHRRQ